MGVSIRNIDNNDATAVEAFLAPVAHGRGADPVPRPAPPIVLGGAGFTLFPDELMQLLDADYGIVGEGEQALALFDALADGRSPDGLPGVAVRGRRAPAPVPLARRRAEARRARPATRRSTSTAARGGILNLQTQRGCPFRCVYCTYPSIEGRLARRFPPDEVARVARELEGAGARFLFLTDSVFNGDPAHAEGVAEAFRRAELGVPWGAFFAPTAPPEGFYARMARARCSHVEFGTESLSDRMLGRMRKTFRQADVLAAHRAALDAGIHVAHFLLLGGPGETPGDARGDPLRRGGAGRGRAVLLLRDAHLPGHRARGDRALREGQLEPGKSLLEPVFYEPPALSLATDRPARGAARRRARELDRRRGLGARGGARRAPARARPRGAALGKARGMTGAGGAP